MLFNLDTPNQTQLNYLTRFSGWYIPEKDHPVKLTLYLNGKPYVALWRGISYRFDLESVFPHKQNVGYCGFWGDLLLPKSIKPGEKIEIEIISEEEDNLVISLFKQEFILDKNAQGIVPRQCSFNIQELLSLESQNLSESNEIKLNDDKTVVYLRGNTPHILANNELPFLNVMMEANDHPYSDAALQVLEKIGGDKLILDFGAGNTPIAYVKPNICYLDVQQFHYTDIVCNTKKLPFIDNCFDAIISHSVFEHLPNPFETAQELYRVLKPGGLIFIEVAFMQPLHAVPNHYFNMTLSGLRQVMSEFEELQSGVLPYQYPSHSLMMQMQTILPHLADRNWKKYLNSFTDRLQKYGYYLDVGLSEIGRETLAAGVFFVGQKLEKEHSSLRVELDLQLEEIKSEEDWYDEEMERQQINYESSWDLYAKRWKKTFPELTYIGDEWIGKGAGAANSLAEYETLIQREFIEPYIKKEHTVLEIGVGGGKTTNLLLKYCDRVICADISQEMLNATKNRLGEERVTYIKVDGITLENITPGVADVCFSYDTMVHLEPVDIYNYLTQIPQLLKGDRVCIFHHSNICSKLGWQKFLSEWGKNILGNRNGTDFSIMNDVIMEQFLTHLNYEIIHKDTQTVPRDCIWICRAPQV
jgi:ubiquinone/menaquinone biosynthesis C-methylase UbiE